MIRSKVVQLQTQLKQVAVALIRQLDASYTVTLDEIKASRQSMLMDVASISRMIEAARSGIDVDGLDSYAVMDSIFNGLASTLSQYGVISFTCKA